MKLKEGISLVDFLKAARGCQSDVYLETEEKDRLNLQSTLSQYVLAVMSEKKEFLEKSIVYCSEEDYESLKEYIQK